MLFFVGCVEEERDANSNSLNAANNNDSTVSITEITPTAVSVKADYDESSFSQYIYFQTDSILVDYNFLPAGTDICQQVTYNAETNPNGCQQANSVVIPCEYQGLVDNDLLSINISETTETTGCDDDLVVDVSGATFTVDGLVFSFSTSLDVFENYFEFLITRDGFVDSSDSQIINSDTLEGVYDLIVEKRSSP